MTYARSVLRAAKAMALQRRLGPERAKLHSKHAGSACELAYHVSANLPMSAYLVLVMVYLPMLNAPREALFARRPDASFFEVPALVPI